MEKKRTITIDSFFKRTSLGDEQASSKRPKASTSEPEEVEIQQENPVNVEAPIPQSNSNGVDPNDLERDPGKRKQMWNYPPNLREQVRLAYLSLGPYQIKLRPKEYKKRGTGTNARKFVVRWFNIYSNWLEYSPTTHSAYCFLCYLFNDKANVGHDHDSFTVEGFNNWRNVHSGTECSFLTHIKSQQHKNALLLAENLLNQEAHIENVILKTNDKLILKNRLRLKVTVDVIRWLTFQACALRGHDESSTSMNRGNFLELLELLASYNDEVAKVILENAPYNSKYTSSDIQKELLSIIANKVRKSIRREVGDSYFCIMVDESRDESKKEQMAIVLRFVDAEVLIKERFLDMVHVRDTMSATLKASISKQLLHYEFDASKLRGQGYDGASNMRGEWNGLQALVLNECPYAYYVHCFAHRLQLALVGASKDVVQVQKFFDDLSSIISVVCASSKRHDELQKAQGEEFKKLLELGEIQTGKGLNQLGTLRRAGDTRWGSHYNSVCSLIRMFNVTKVVLKGIEEDKTHTTNTQRGQAYAAYGNLMSFEFVFLLHLIKDVMGKSDSLSQSLQKKSQDILNAMELVETTKACLNNFRNNGWDNFFKKVASFCKTHDIEIPDMKAPYTSTHLRPRKKDLHVTFEHYYRVDVFTATLDTQVHELNSRFNEKAMELLSLSASLVSKKIDIEKICLLVEKYYPEDFTEQERNDLEYQLDHLNIEMTHNTKLSGVSTLSDLCKVLVETKKHETYYLVDRVVRLILTLPVSTATTERAFSAMKIFKNRLRTKMSDDYLANSLVIYIEREIAEDFDSECIIDEFKNLKGRRAEL